jgi:hypothetical protein
MNQDRVPINEVGTRDEDEGAAAQAAHRQGLVIQPRASAYSDIDFFFDEINRAIGGDDLHSNQRENEIRRFQPFALPRTSRRIRPVCDLHARADGWSGRAGSGGHSQGTSAIVAVGSRQFFEQRLQEQTKGRFHDNSAWA